MANYFNAEYYFAAKAKQLSKTSDGKTWTAADVQAEFAKQGIKAEDHYKAYGASEGLSPNAYFNEKEYLASKLAALQDNDPTWANKTVADLQAEFKALGINAADHYEQYGAFETRKDGTLLNPSNAFDANAYFAAKLAQLQKIGFEGADTMTVADVVKAVQEAGISPVAHLQAYGAAEAKTDGIPLVQTVPVAQRVPNDPIRAQFGELVPSNYNPPSKAPAAAVAAPVTKPADVGGLSANKPVIPTAPVKVPGDTGYIAPPANLVDTNEKPVLPPTTTEGTGPNAGFIVVDPTTGKGTVIDPATGAEKGTVDVVVKDGVVTPPAPNAPVVDKDGNNINDKPADDTGKPVEPTPPTVDPDEGEGDGGGGTVTPPAPTFDVTEGTGANVGKWTVASNNAVTVSEEGNKFVFTPATGTAVKVAKNDIIHLVANGELKGTPEVLAKIPGLTGTGTATLTGDTAAATVVELKAINDALGVVTLNPASKVNSATFTDTAAILSDAFDGITGLTGTVTVSGASSTATLSELLTINNATTGTVTLADGNITANYSGSKKDLLTAFEKVTTHTGTLTVTDSLTVEEANKLDAATTGVITAKISNGDIITLKTLTNDNTNSAYTIKISDTTADAADLKIINTAVTTGDIDASAITKITGSFADINAAYTAGFAGLGDEELVVTGNTASGDAVTILNRSTGKVTVKLENAEYTNAVAFAMQLGDTIKLTLDNGTEALGDKVATAAAVGSNSGGWFFDTSEDGTKDQFTWWDGSSAQTITLNNAGNVTVTANGTLTVIKPDAAFAVNSAGGSSTIGTENGHVKVTLNETKDKFIFTPTDGEADEVLASLIGTGSDKLVVGSEIILSGAAEVLAALKNIDGKVTVDNVGAVKAADLEKIAALSDISAGDIILGTSVTSITGTATDIAAVFANTDIIGKSALDVAITGEPSQAQLKAINDATTGTITLDTTGKTVALTGASAADTLATIEGITGYTGTVTVTDVATNAKTLLALDALTTGQVDATAIKTTTAITGTVADLKAMIAAKTATTLDFHNTADVTISDEIRTDIAAADLKAIDAAAGAVTVTNAVHVTGTKVDVTAALVGGVTLAANSTVTITDAVTAAEGKAIVDVATATAKFAGGVFDTLDNLLNTNAAHANVTGIFGEDSSVSVIANNATTITATQLKALDAASGHIATSATGGWKITDLDSNTVSGTASVDKFVFANDDTATITNFTSTKDKLDVNAFTTSTKFDAEHTKANAATAVTIAADKIYLITGGAAGDADSADASATLINGSGVWTNAGNGAVAYFVVVDDNSTAIYKYTEAGGAEVTTAELGTAIATIGGEATIAGDFIFA